MIPKGYLYVICCACSFGFIPTLAKLTYNEGASLELVAFFRITVSYTHLTLPTKA
mgnify:CR=1 FL=1